MDPRIKVVMLPCLRFEIAPLYVQFPGNVSFFFSFFFVEEPESSLAGIDSCRLCAETGSSPWPHGGCVRVGQSLAPQAVFTFLE